MTEWEMYQDPAYYDMWAVRDKADRKFDSPRLFHFILKSEAEAFLEAVKKSHVAEATP